MMHFWMGYNVKGDSWSSSISWLSVGAFVKTWTIYSNGFISHQESIGDGGAIVKWGLAAWLIQNLYSVHEFHVIHNQFQQRKSLESVPLLLRHISRPNSMCWKVLADLEPVWSIQRMPLSTWCGSRVGRALMWRDWKWCLIIPIVYRSHALYVSNLLLR